MGTDKPKVDVAICTCECHIKGTSVLHFMACCAHSYLKYINPDGTIDFTACKSHTLITIQNKIEDENI